MDGSFFCVFILGVDLNICGFVVIKNDFVCMCCCEKIVVGVVEIILVVCLGVGFFFCVWIC